MHGVALYCYCWNLYMSGNEEREKKRIGWFCRRRRCFFLFLLCRMSFSMCENARHIHVGLQLSLVSQKKQQQQPTNSSSARSHRFFLFKNKSDSLNAHNKINWNRVKTREGNSNIGEIDFDVLCIRIFRLAIIVLCKYRISIYKILIINRSMDPICCIYAIS